MSEKNPYRFDEPIPGMLAGIAIRKMNSYAGKHATLTMQDEKFFRELALTSGITLEKELISDDDIANLIIRRKQTVRSTGDSFNLRYCVTDDGLVIRDDYENSRIQPEQPRIIEKLGLYAKILFGRPTHYVYERPFDDSTPQTDREEP